VKPPSANARRERTAALGWLAVSAAALVLAGLVVTAAVAAALAPGWFDPLAIALRPTATGTSSPTPTASAVRTPTPRPTTAVPRATSSATATVIESPTPTAEPSTAIPTATWFYVVPAQPTPIPTPVLPEVAPFPTSCDGPGRMNILLIGIDGFSNNYGRSARADTLIVLGVNFADKSARMLSVPRDLWVALPGLAQVPEGRINTAYHYGELYQAAGGGPGELAAVFANTFGLRIDRYVVVSFSAFEQGIDAIGGIDLNIPEPIHDSHYPLRDGSGTIAVDFPAGAVHLDGSNALIYARIRHDSSDFRRMRRQQQVLFAVRNRLLSAETVTHLPALAQVLYGAARTNLSLEDLALLGCLGVQINQEAIQTWVIDSSMTADTRLADGAQVLTPKLETILPVLELFNAGQ
jgi:polyisoprenyl-teichoic acid--peptidoglycan teichoic acid transferase